MEKIGTSLTKINRQLNPERRYIKHIEKGDQALEINHSGSNLWIVFSSGDVRYIGQQMPNLRKLPCTR